LRYRGGHADWGGRQKRRLTSSLGVFQWYTHVATITAFATVSLVFANTLIRAETSVAATTAWPLAIAALLALAASLTARLGREVWLIVLAWLSWDKWRRD